MHYEAYRITRFWRNTEGFPVGLQRVLIIHCRQAHESVYNCNGGGKGYSTSAVIRAPT